MRLILFDADGTLVDSHAVIHEAMAVAFTRFGYESPSPAQTRSVIGLALDRAIAVLLGREIDNEIVAIALEYREAWIELSLRGDLQCRAFEGMAAMVRRLASRPDYLLGIVTGKSRHGLNQLVNSAEFEGCFIATRCADDCPSKPHPAMVLECCGEVGVHPTSTLVIGDTTFDAEMAQAAGARMVGVAWGYHPARRIRDAGASIVVDSTLQLEKAVHAWAEGCPLGESLQGASRAAGLGSFHSVHHV